MTRAQSFLLREQCIDSIEEGLQDMGYKSASLMATAHYRSGAVKIYRICINGKMQDHIWIGVSKSGEHRFYHKAKGGAA